MALLGARLVWFVVVDPDLQAAHAAAPWLVVMDDHEVADNWAAEAPARPQPAFLEQRAGAL
ncbi:MAG TPA: alkaline phosphatase D family protein, partial [Mycobacterium sp.]|nr:alkaline phosphatase D family protein [Mycobacterium sp.]